MAKKKGVKEPRTTQKVVKDTSEIPVEVIKEIKKDIPVLIKAFRKIPETKQKITEICKCYLKEKVGVYTWYDWVNALDMLGEKRFGVSISKTIHMAMNKGPGIFKEMESVAGSKDIISFLREITAIYGKQVVESYRLAGENPNDCAEVDRWVYYDEYRKKWSINFEMTKYNGEKFMLQAKPTTFLWLASMMLKTLGFIPNSEAISSDVISRYKEIIADFEKTFLRKPRKTKGGK